MLMWGVREGNTANRNCAMGAKALTSKERVRQSDRTQLRTAYKLKLLRVAGIKLFFSIVILNPLF